MILYDRLRHIFWAIYKSFHLMYLRKTYKNDIPYSEDINETNHCPNCGLYIDMDDFFDNPSFIGSTPPRSYGIDGAIQWQTYWSCKRCGHQWCEDESN